MNNISQVAGGVSRNYKPSTGKKPNSIAIDRLSVEIFMRLFSHQGVYRNYNPFIEKSSLIDRLPVEIFMKVFSYLRGSDIQQTCLVSHDWKAKSIDFAKHKIHFKITEFAKFLGKNLQPGFYSTQMETFFQIANSTTILDSKTLAQIKSSIDLQKEDILNTLKSLHKEDLNKLEELYKNENQSIYFNQTFKLANIYKQRQIIAKFHFLFMRPTDDIA